MAVKELPAPTSFSLPGANGFPCCDQKSVEIVDMRDDLNQYPFYNPRMVQEEEEKIELEEELLDQEPPPKANLDLDLELDPDPDPELELMALLKSELQPPPTPEAERDKWKVTNGNEDLGTQGYRIESVHPYIEGLPMLHNFRPWSAGSNTSYLSSLEERPVPTEYRSIPVQTSKHLFWANKFTQASEHSLQQINKQLHKSSMDKTTSHQHFVPTNTLCSKKHFHTSTAHTALPATSSQPPPSAHLSSSGLSPAIGLAELIHFASSLAMASSSKTDLPSLEHRIKAKLQKPVEPFTEPIRPATSKQELEKHKETLPKKPPEAREPQKTWNQEGKSFSHPYLDFSKLGNKRTTIEGEVKLLQSPATSPDQLQGAKENSVPGTKKGNPLLLQIHFKLSSPSTPEQ
ncbi:spermatogenesis-associated protein 32 [Eulemur rufifrons]|uniref:spermatogenesis-associated protein 32 n=1 Tax=Eulemur rufifrons TaxID=859984 RepID=UPI0037433657